jgi:hypothetical protein
MNNSCPKRETISIEDATVSNMWDIAALVEVLERKGHCTTEDLYDINMEFRCFYRVKKYTAPAGSRVVSLVAIVAGRMSWSIQGPHGAQQLRFPTTSCSSLSPLWRGPRTGISSHSTTACRPRVGTT